ncbi:glutathione S-transferase family protein [Nodosilinea sp. FACHB-13]|uniref:glutathione S-transferase family protein n=2 Tax=Cyanophyceae TaxID=3028117 RepID=UPI001682CC52|nr:glutathione S-transferase family protein [Nodosilinea sp. FACHB-13]MBD2108975.1 glutathione S-transferase family protein [Nodosilinea sp. FACHB-13]
MGLGLLVNGQWQKERSQEDDKGRFVRPETDFHHFTKADGSSEFKPEADRYHLYVSLACPWAHRTLIMRELKGLTDAISVSVVDPYMGEEGWAFSDYPGAIPDVVNGAQYLREIYVKAKPDISGRVTVPILWDKQTNTIVNNESREIIRMLDTEWNGVATNDVDLYPANLQDKIDSAIDAIYQPINNGVYRAGFATKQSAYEEAVTELFDALDHWEGVLDRQRYLCGDRLTEADICLFTTLYRFDAVYYVHFKCNLRRIVDYPNLWGYLRDLYQQPAFKNTCNMDHIKRHYYMSHPGVNPHQIVPLGPVIDFEEKSDRAKRFSLTAGSAR